VARARAIADLAAQSPQAQEDYVAGNAIPADTGVLLRPVADARTSDPARPSAQVRVPAWANGPVRSARPCSPAPPRASPNRPNTKSAPPQFPADAAAGEPVGAGSDEIEAWILTQGTVQEPRVA